MRKNSSSICYRGYPSVFMSLEKDVHDLFLSSLEWKPHELYHEELFKIATSQELQDVNKKINEQLEPVLCNKTEELSAETEFQDGYVNLLVALLRVVEVKTMPLWKLDYYHDYSLKRIFSKARLQNLRDKPCKESTDIEPCFVISS